VPERRDPQAGRAVIRSGPSGRRLSVALVLAWLALAVSLADAQPLPRNPHIGLLSVGTDPSRPLPPQWLAFFEGMRALGWVEGQNIQVERRFAAGNSEAVPGFATELARLGVDVIVATGLRENQAVHRVTRTIPVVMIVVDDPVESGFVQSLARPGGNFTGVTFSTSGVAEKYVELLKEAVPSLARVEILASRQQRPALIEDMGRAARTLGMTLAPLTLARDLSELESALGRIARERNRGLIFPNDGFVVLNRRQVVALVAKHRLPAIYASREQVEVGGLMAYGPSFVERFRQAATFVHKILKGAKPADLPVEQPIRFELTVNLRTAKALGLTIPPSLLARADEVIDR
jgi:putative ABC transport system substrate-binding protein